MHIYESMTTLYTLPILQALILAATDTTAVTLTWIISPLLNHHDILNKARNELDIQVGTKRQVNESDIKKFSLLTCHS